MIYKRGPDGYPIGADEKEKQSFGKIPDATEFFNIKTNKFEVPDEVLGCEFSTFHFRWGAHVRFKGNIGHGFSFPKKRFVYTNKSKDVTDDFGW